MMAEGCITAQLGSPLFDRRVMSNNNDNKQQGDNSTKNVINSRLYCLGKYLFWIKFTSN